MLSQTVLRFRLCPCVFAFLPHAMTSPLCLEQVYALVDKNKTSQVLSISMHAWWTWDSILHPHSWDCSFQYLRPPDPTLSNTWTPTPLISVWFNNSLHFVLWSCFLDHFLRVVTLAWMKRCVLPWEQFWRSASDGIILQKKEAYLCQHLCAIELSPIAGQHIIPLAPQFDVLKCFDHEWSSVKHWLQKILDGLAVRKAVRASRFPASCTTCFLEFKLHGFLSIWPDDSWGTGSQQVNH